ncbi:MAG: arylformamidase [Paraglaciecola sp.]|jgi:arylformamidase
MKNIDQYDLDKLNREYSPSSCIDDINIYIQQYISLSHQAKDLADIQNTLHVDLQYAESETQRLDLYMPSQSPQDRLMVYIHGGYWQELSKEESSFAATNFQQQGFHFAVIDYTLAPKASLTEIVEENRQAMAWLYTQAAKFGYNPEHIYVCGSSAGAHLAMMMLQTDWSNYMLGYQGNIIKGVCAVSGIYDLRPLISTYINAPLKMDIAEAQRNSPLMLPLPKAVPVIIAFGENETSEFKRQSKIMSEQLRTHGFTVQYKEIIGRNHFDVILGLCDQSSWLSQQTIALISRY